MTDRGLGGSTNLCKTGSGRVAIHPLPDMKIQASMELSFTQRLYYGSLLAYLAVLPMAETIALRNLLLLLLLCLLLYAVWVRPSTLVLSPRAFFAREDGLLLAWILFLCLFPLWAVQSNVAWANFLGQWGETIIAWAVGLGAALVLGRQGPGLWAWAGASAFLVILHLLLSLMAWAGLFGSPVPPEMSFGMMWNGLLGTFSSSGEGWSWQSFPWGFRGFDPMHGNLGYTETQAVALLAVCLFMGWRSQRPSWIWGSVLGLVACFLSIAIANSRGAVLYSLLVLLGALVVFFLRLRRAPDIGAGVSAGRRFFNYRVALFFLALALVVTLVQSMHKDARWHSMVDRVRVAFMVEDPIDFLCNNASEDVRQQLKERLAVADPRYAEEVLEGLNSDGGRILLMRAGLELVKQHPWGLDGSRHSYKKLMQERCGHTPAFEFAHAHQGWLDTALALGWAGALLLAALFVQIAWVGWRGLTGEAWPWAFALLLLSVFWLLRGFADSVYREHYLQMQALLLGYLLGRIRLAQRGLA